MSVCLSTKDLTGHVNVTPADHSQNWLSNSVSKTRIVHISDVEADCKYYKGGVWKKSVVVSREFIHRAAVRGRSISPRKCLSCDREQFSFPHPFQL